ncbi:MAG: ArsR/SmtB family transcription factor [Gemmataceae bacterium]
MVKRDASLDAIFTALAHPARRAILRRLCRGEATVGELAKPLKISLPAVTKHLDILERARLITRSIQAQWRLCQLQVAPLDLASEWIAEQRKIWEARLDRLEHYLDTLEPQEKGNEDHE